ncbi:MAG: Fic family protein, partial [Thermodesulfobacteriota bacterium]|nr:Fic family protein [Thermodesulfobacteriota bacterium]
FPVRNASDVGEEFYTTAFFDAYFSNFIEGTEFEVEEAFEIVDSGIVPPTRPKDGHDILGTYRIVGSIDEMTKIANTFEEFENLLISRHAVILEGRPDKRPGQYKLRPNVAGLTRFVDPALVRGTLRQGFELYRGLAHPFARALAMMFFVLEVHPFDDGNGRIARAMMNAELVASKQVRIIVPSVFRNEYLSGLKRMTNECDPIAFIRQMQHVQEVISRIDFSSKNGAIERLRHCNAFAAPANDIKLRMP